MSTEYPKIRVGIIGVGQIGKSHVRNYQEIDDAEIVAVADINEAEANRVAAQYNIPNVYTDFHAMLQRDDIDAVDVCLHNNFHRWAAVAGMEAGKHVFCEKPMAGAYADAKAMFDTAQTTGQKFSIQLAHLFSKESKAAKALIDAGELGKLYHGRALGHRRRGRPFVDGYGTPTFVQKENSGGGALYDMGVYHISNMLYLLGNPEVTRISGKTYQETDIDPTRFEISHYNVEELGLGFVRFSNKITMDLIEAWAIHVDKFEGSTIYGSKGGIRLDPFSFHRSMGDLDLDASFNLDLFNWRLHTVRENGDAYDSPQKHWIAAVQGRVALLPTAEIALNTMLVSEGIYLSNQLDREVTADEIREMSKSTAIKI